MLTFNLKKEWFEKIKSSEETHVYREVKPSWTGRLAKGLYGIKEFSDLFLIMLLQANFVYKPQKVIKICFMNGMVSKKVKPRLYAILKLISIVNGKDTDLKIDKPVYDIEFVLIKD